MMVVDLLLDNCGQIATCASVEGGPKRGAQMGDVGLLDRIGWDEPNGAIAVHEGVIVDFGPASQLRDRYQPRQVIDAGNRAVCPGFVDPHTHLVFGGDRVHEFELRIQGATYMEIMAAGGGIVSTVTHTRETDPAQLAARARARLDEMLASGSTTVEIKSGYGLDLETELKMLRVIEQLDQEHPCDIVPTFLGAHTVPPLFKDEPEGYVRLLIEQMTRAVAMWYERSHFAESGFPLYIDVFCEDHAFDLQQTRRILEAGLACGMRPKIHADQFNALGGVDLAIEMGAISADHLDVTGQEAIERLARSDVLAVPLPAVNFNLGLDHYADARGMIDAGAAVALATDLNPGSAPCYSMALVMAIACRYQNLLPAEALNAATINAAHAIGRADRVGSIEVGKQADLLVLKEDDYRHISYFFGGNPVAQIIKSGELIV